MLNIYKPLRTAFSFVLAMLLLSSCMKDKLSKTYTITIPVYKSKQEVLASVKFAAPQTISSPGKIYIFGKYIFLNELNKGVHVIDNANASSPRVIGFINIPGNVDIAVKGNMLYADMYADLLAIDISDPVKTKLVKTLPKLFPERFYGLGYSSDTSKIIVDWIRKDTTVDVMQEGNYGGCPNCAYASSPLTADKSSSSAAGGIGGSMARFTIVNDYMYTVGQSDLSILSVTNSADPVVVGTQKIGMNIETIYPFKDKLFIGSAAGMFIYNIANPSTPKRESEFSHARACDPVIADDNYAYVTLRTGTWCAGTTNTLDVVDIANITAPRLVKTYQLKNPHGLSKDGDLLFICDGTDGLKLYNASNVSDLKLLDHIKELETYDVIAWNKLLMVVSRDGLHQYDYSDGKSMRLLSTIRINKKP
ncbi:MAG: hypothetical protein EOO04_17325 [Chitinophagaceae bacterium]|nr:MAG: hypothetical protein EOO04_17325 [Chitinophagaceae bacterium]